MNELKDLINNKIEEIQNYAIGTQEDEERYIEEIQTLVHAKFLLFGEPQDIEIITMDNKIDFRVK
jgi:hypothetical protein